MVLSHPLTPPGKSGPRVYDEDNLMHIIRGCPEYYKLRGFGEISSLHGRRCAFDQSTIEASRDAQWAVRSRHSKPSHNELLSHIMQNKCSYRLVDIYHESLSVNST